MHLYCTAWSVQNTSGKWSPVKDHSQSTSFLLFSSFFSSAVWLHLSCFPAACCVISVRSGSAVRVFLILLFCIPVHAHTLPGNFSAPAAFFAPLSLLFADSPAASAAYPQDFFFYSPSWPAFCPILYAWQDVPAYHVRNICHTIQGKCKLSRSYGCYRSFHCCSFLPYDHPAF